MDIKILIALIVIAIIVIVGVVAFILYRKKKQYDFVFKMMEQKKKQEALAQKEKEFAAKRAEMSATEATLFVEHLGGPENVQAVKQCAIRIRVQVKDRGKVNQKGLKQAGVSGVIKTTNGIQLVVGDRAEQIADEMEKML